MPVPFKILLTVLVALVGITAHFWQMDIGNVAPAWVALGLGAFMIFALWLFPETKRRSPTSRK
ncbi:MAG TPA: hypothetical protein DCL95_14315 [Rhodospirillaceae bacterium]|jgi:hypothetical protein|nr:hypothetical protein [Rhodospirillaceae bacterium]MAX64092.1 hypothetical protein [Rhodospirillaceae bacterium]MBB57350.1 hypothetical protein [Rhodospirillaceae bacterium]HAE00604.1 hypothetical protein [Rhodospirillaceae bacterium]HAJ21205.1 hypothetical protein [Rhodospirillaceae bacterium]|tara:strand:- start:441 stop:629 length:189 start_codon:yes stop_codon:yes gene_type:complete